MGYTKQYYQLLRSCLYTVGDTIKDIAGVDKAITTNNGNHLAMVGFANLGIKVGTSNTTPTPTDYKLGTVIADGTGSGQLQYSALTINLVSTTTTKSRISIIRTFTNGSGASITVEEVGLYAIGHSAAADNVMCILRGLKNFTIPDGESRTVEILLEATA